MAVTILSNGAEVVVDSQIYSWDSNFRVLGSMLAGSSLGREDLHDPLYVYRTQRSVRIVVDFLAGNLAQVPMHGFEVEDDGDRRRLNRDHPLARTLRKPHPTATAYELKRQLGIDRCLFNRWAAIKAADDRGAVRLVRLPPRKWQYRRDQFDLPASVVWRPSPTADAVEIPLESLVWMDGYWPDDQSSPVDALYELLNEEAESSDYRAGLWANGARIPGWIERPVAAPKWSDLAKSNFKAGWRDYAAGGSRVGREPILEDGMIYHQTTGVSPRDGQQIEARKLSISEVAAAFQIPAVFVGLLDSTSHSNVSAYREQLYADVLGSHFQEIEQAFNARLVPEFDSSGSLFIEFTVAEKLRLAFEDQARIFQTTTGGPFMTRNEARQRLNLPRLDGADELIVPLNVIEGGQASPTDSAPD